MAFPESWLNELLSKNDIVAVVSSYVELKPKGRRLWGLCPVHGEKTASFSVSPERQLYYCFGCHIGGSVIQFIMDVEHMTFPEAVEFLANRSGMAMPEEVNDAAMQRERAKRERLSEACKIAARFYMETLLGEQGAAGRAYLKKRGITSESVKRFGIGYAPSEWEALKSYLGEKGFSPEELVEAGLLVRNEQSGRTYDAYRGRVIFPIINASGRVVGFGARVLNNEEKPKYINTGDTLLYNKRNNLYGLNQQKSGKLADLVMVEGYTDVIGLYEAGVTNAVASLGTALTQQQARLLKRYVS
ncbi:MAG: DNA primase, partial [Christensenella sp.]|nr:DNA primase [Christensenella sp.]